MLPQIYRRRTTERGAERSRNYHTSAFSIFASENRIHTCAPNLIVGTADGKSDRRAYTNHVVIAEVVGVIHDVIVVNLGAHKDSSPHVVTDAASDVYQEVVAGCETGVEIDAVGRVGETVEASTLQTDAGHKIETDFLIQAGLIHSVEVGQDGTEGLSARSSVRSLAAFPRGLKAEADAFFENDVGADAGIKASLFGATRSYGASRFRRQEGAAAEHHVSLLGRSELGDAQEGENWSEKR
jgi:hypothetical protein